MTYKMTVKYPGNDDVSTIHIDMKKRDAVRAKGLFLTGFSCALATQGIYTETYTFDELFRGKEEQLIVDTKGKEYVRVSLEKVK